MGNTIPPPPPVPETEPESEKSETSKTVALLKRWWKTATTIGSVLVAIGAVGSKLWAFGAEVSELRDTIRANKIEVARLGTEMVEARDEYEAERDSMLEAIRAARARDRDDITDLRIAVAALQAAQAVRQGRASYNGEGDVSFAEAPRSARERAAQVSSAEEDARQALARSRQRQEEASNDDPLGSLNF